MQTRPSGSFATSLATRVDACLEDDPDGVIRAGDLKPLVDGVQQEVEALYTALERLPEAWIAFVRDADEDDEDNAETRLLKLLSWAARRLPHSVREQLAAVDPRIAITD